MEEIKKKVFKVIASSFNLDENSIKLNDTKKDIESWDSIGHLQLIMKLEEVFKIRFNTEDIVKINSVKECVHIIDKMMNRV